LGPFGAKGVELLEVLAVILAGYGVFVLLVGVFRGLDDVGDAGFGILADVVVGGGDMHEDHAEVGGGQGANSPGVSEAGGGFVGECVDGGAEVLHLQVRKSAEGGSDDDAGGEAKE